MRFLNEASSTDPAKYNSAIAVVSPYLANSTLLNSCSVDQVTELIAASSFLMERSNTTMFEPGSLAKLNGGAVMRWIDLALARGPEYLSQPGIGQSIGRHIVYQVMGLPQPHELNEASFGRCFETFKTNVSKNVLQPGVVGNIMASTGKGGLRAMAKADKRSKNGRFTQADLQMLRPIAAQYRPAVRIVARYQQAMGWQPTTWDPVSVCDMPGYNSW